MTIVDALLAIGRGDLAGGADIANEAAVANADDLLAVSLARFLAKSHDTEVYAQPTAFEEFISNGANPELYRCTIDHLSSLHATVRPTAILDVGCGDGRVTARALTPSTRRLDLVEPSKELLRVAVDETMSTDRIVVGHDCGVVEFLAEAGPEVSWDLVQSTFALHSLSPAIRVEVLRDLSRRADQLAIVEFDVPDFVDGSREHATYAAERYSIGVAEYRDHLEVIDGFLMPVLVGQFDPKRHRSTFEAPAGVWSAQLAEAGWSVVKKSHLAEYWWAPAFCLEAIPEALRPLPTL